ncbi:hypothetical protein L211DRAFT_853037 [Terfezia boudieri ATCC MYA-4762]|uniref:Uncharacterized protein n=1 Tax=Terfezia boudieri ATCC MYA-4762 TaxID=1051890 RepID=A0A3N4L9X3_9PEZI|nr:hypothetical protein L211DRAFT_853037 [Terfezia boudieri ATCC MYA-4762]
MGPQGQVQYNRDIICRNVWILYDDIAKKARNSHQSMWDMVQRARDTYHAANRRRARIAARSAQAPAPAVSVPAPVIPVPAPVIPIPAPVIPVLAPVIPVPAPVVPIPAPVIPVPAPIVPVPLPVVPVPPLVVPVPPPVIPVPPPVIPVPPPVVPVPAPVIPVPAPVIPVLAPVIPVPPPVVPVPAAPVVPAGPAAPAGPLQAPAVLLQAPAVPLHIPAIPLQAPAIPLPAVPLLVILVPPGMQQVPIVIPPLSLPGSAGGVAGGPLAAHTCHRVVPHRWPMSTGGLPTSVRIHIIISENYMRDVACGRWFFTTRTASGTVRILAHTMAELVLHSELFLPWELEVVRQIIHFYVLGRLDRWSFLPLGMASNQQLTRHITADYSGGNMLDIQAEVAPPGLVPVAITELGGAGHG